MGGRAQWLQKLYKISRRTIKHGKQYGYIYTDAGLLSLSILNILYDNDDSKELFSNLLVSPYSFSHYK